MVSAEFFDIFGFIGFLILLFTGISIIKKARKEAWIIITISLIGLLVDGYIVISRFILN